MGRVAYFKVTGPGGWRWPGIESDVPDLTRGAFPEFGPACGHVWTRFRCTRSVRKGPHTGRHAAGTGFKIVAVWR